MITLAQSTHRLQTESAFGVSARVEQLKREGKPVINLGIGQPDFKTAPHIVEAAVKALHDGHHGYTIPNGILPLRESVSAYIHARYQKDISPERILIVPGGKVTMFLAIMMFGEPGAEIIYPNPGFPIYESVINYSGATAVPLPLLEENAFSFDAEQLIELITEQTRLIIINSPSNPTGGIVPKAEWDKLANALDKWPNVTIMVDEIYSHQTYDHEHHHSFLHYEHLYDRTIILEGWSKTWAMTGWRLGYGIWPKSLIEKATHFCVNIHSCVNSAAQYAAIAAMEGTQEPIHTMLREFDTRRKYIHQRLNAMERIHAVLPKGAFYIFPNIKQLGESSLYWQNRLLEEAHVGSIAGSSFGAYGEGYLRLSYASSMEDIEEALSRMEHLIT